MNAMERKSYFVDLMLMMGIPVVRALGEAEMTCCALLNKNMVCTIMSRDTDHLVLGCSNLIISLGPNSVEQLNLTKLLTKLRLTHRQFVDFCILCGNDYNMPNYNGYTKCLMQPEKALDIIQTYNSIENAIDFVKLPTTNFKECREKTEVLTDLDKGKEDWLKPAADVWCANKRLLISMGMRKTAVSILDRYYRR